MIASGENQLVKFQDLECVQRPDTAHLFSTGVSPRKIKGENEKIISGVKNKSYSYSFCKEHITTLRVRGVTDFEAVDLFNYVKTMTPEESGLDEGDIRTIKYQICIEVLFGSRAIEGEVFDYLIREFPSANFGGQRYMMSLITIFDYQRLSYPNKEKCLMFCDDLLRGARYATDDNNDIWYEVFNLLKGASEEIDSPYIVNRGDYIFQHIQTQKLTNKIELLSCLIDYNAPGTEEKLEEIKKGIPQHLEYVKSRHVDNKYIRLKEDWRTIEEDELRWEIDRLERKIRLQKQSGNAPDIKKKLGGINREVPPWLQKAHDDLTQNPEKIDEFKREFLLNSKKSFDDLMQNPEKVKEFNRVIKMIEFDL